MTSASMGMNMPVTILLLLLSIAVIEPKKSTYKTGSKSVDIYNSKAGRNSGYQQKDAYNKKLNLKLKNSGSYESKSLFNSKDVNNPKSGYKSTQKYKAGSKYGYKDAKSYKSYDFGKYYDSKYKSGQGYGNPYGYNYYSKEGSYKSGYGSKGGSYKSGYGSKGGSYKSGYGSKGGYYKSGTSSKEGYAKSGYDTKGGYSKSGSNSKEGYAKSGYDTKGGYSKSGSNSKEGYAKSGYDSKGGYSKSGYSSREGYEKSRTESKGAYNSKTGYNNRNGIKSVGGYNTKYGNVEPDVKKELYFSSAPGHCKPICPCYMNGVTYDHGDRWQPKGDPCTTYQCGNGFYEAVVRGVMYKGECKNVGTKWTEECFTYTVKLVENTPFYRLMEGGCRDDEGNCWKVGDRFKRNCNTYECQIVGTCYTLSLIAKGCTFDGECKEVNNFWHDGCTIFQCMDKNGQIGIERLRHEIMYWPEGNYGLLKPKTGCPIDIDEKWSEGFRGHIGNLHNYVSFDFHAFGTYNAFVFIHYFCVHQHIYDPTIYPRYQTYWEPGKYCILRKNGTCPEDFKKGFIGMDDSATSARVHTVNGTLPDGDYNNDTGLYFCCRDDGKIEVPLVLPKEKPFILFVDSSADGCQEVRGMEHTMEFFAFDDANEDGKPSLNGSIPMTKDGDNNTEIYFCHYKPVDCGCDDGEGNVVLVGDRVKKNCTWYTCKDEEGIRILTVDEGACMDETGTCRKEGETWMVSSGVTCYSKRCLRKDNGVKVFFEIKTDYRGCKDENYCRPINYQTQRGCYASVCALRPSTGECYFRMKKAGCSDGKGKCIPLGQEFKKGCMTYKCSAETTKCGMKFLRGACSYDDGCHEVNSVWHHSSCHWLKCTMTKKDKSVTFSIDSVEQECNYQGKCYKAGYRVKEGCYTKQCIIDPQKKVAYMNIVDGGCQYNGKCMGVNMTWTVGCTEYICRWYQKGLRHVFQNDINNMQCRYGKQCVNKGDMRKHNCIDYECTVTTENKAQYAVMKPLYYACIDKRGNCLGINEEIEEKCFLYRCEQKAGSKFPTLQTTGGGCQVNGVCKEENSVWTEYGTCVDYKCVREERNGKIYMVTSPVSVGCPHDGICRQHGEKWPTPNKKCFQTECVISKTPDKKFKRLIKTTPSGCVVNGICREFGYTSYEGCFQYECKWDPVKQYASYKYTKGGCKEYTSSSCHDVGEQWTEKYGKTMCIQLTCKQTGNRFHHDVDYMCQDADGYCINPGEQFESVGYNGKRKYCTCKSTGNHVTAVCRARRKYNY